jgi:calcium-dependent protein kinase
MGICVARQGETKAEEAMETTRQPRQPLPLKAAKTSAAATPLISMERVRSLSGNSSSVPSRYHSFAEGNSGRRLEDDYEVFPKIVLGTGLCGPVVLAKHRLDGKRCALKRIAKTPHREKAMSRLTSEVEIYLTLDHPNVARLFDAYEAETEVCLLTEYCEGGELYARLYACNRFSETEAAQTTRQMLRAVGYLHAHRIVHRDLKLENFLYEKEKQDSNSTLLKLIDFGFAKVFDPETPMLASCGSIAYVSPDVLSGKGYTAMCDLWSMGVIVFMLLVGYPPFHGRDKEMRQTILAGKPDYSHTSRWKDVSKDAVDFVQKLLLKDPEERLDASRALAHRWLCGPSLLTARRPSLPKEAIQSIRQYSQGTRIQRAALQLLAQELTAEEVAELRDCFLSIDTTNEGTIRFDELKDAIRGDCQEDASPTVESSMSPITPIAKIRRAKSEVFKQFFDVLDANGDEQISYSDFLAATMNPRTRVREDAIRAAFHRLDADNSGVITASDIRKTLGDTFEGVNVELLLSDAQRNSEGGLEFEEFRSLVKPCNATPSPARA